MLTAIKFVRGAIAKKDLVPILTSFHIYKGRIQGFNGSVCIDHPLERTDLDITVPAKQFIKAMDICDGEPESIEMLPNNRVGILKGNFQCKIALEDQEAFPVTALPGESCDGHKISGGLLDRLKMVAPFISDDASRPWSMSVKIQDGYMYATNNIILVRVQLAEPCDNFTLSSELVAELLRIWQAPQRVLHNPKEIFFEYPNGAWVKGQVPAGEWPDLSQMFEFDSEDMADIPDGLLQSVEKLSHFSEDGIIRLTEEGVFAGCGDDAQVEGFNLEKIAFHVTPLLAMLRVAKKYDLTAQPPRFKGDRIDGVICNVSI